MGRLLPIGVLAVVGAGIAVAARPGAAALVLQLLILALAATLAVVMVARLASAYRFLPRLSRLRSERATSETDRELSRLRRQVELGTTSRDDFERFLRPVLSEVAVDLLRLRGVEFGEEPLRARRLLGEEAWQLLGAPERQDGRRLSPATLEQAIEGLERL